MVCSRTFSSIPSRNAQNPEIDFSSISVLRGIYSPRSQSRKGPPPYIELEKSSARAELEYEGPKTSFLGRTNAREETPVDWPI